MPRDFRAYLEDLLDAAAKIRDYTAGLTLETFRKDPRTVDAVVRCAISRSLGRPSRTCRKSSVPSIPR